MASMSHAKYPCCTASFEHLPRGRVIARKHLLVRQVLALPECDFRGPGTQGHFVQRPDFHLCETARGITLGMQEYPWRGGKGMAFLQFFHKGLEQLLARG